MRKILLYALAAFVLTSCSDLNKKKSKGGDETEETSTIKKPLKDDEPEEDTKTGDRTDSVEKRKTASYAAGWAPSEKDTFMSTCVSQAKSGMGEVGAKNYCSCMLDKIEKLYPNAADAGKLDQAKMTDLAKECLGQ